MLGPDAGSHQLVADMDAMLDADRERYRAPALAVLQPMLDDVADQLAGIHPALELADDVVALPGLDATQIRIDRRVHPRLDQEAANDEFRDLRALDHGVEDVAEPSTVAATWRCGHA